MRKPRRKRARCGCHAAATQGLFTAAASSGRRLRASGVARAQRDGLHGWRSQAKLPHIRHESGTSRTTIPHTEQTIDAAAAVSGRNGCGISRDEHRRWSPHAPTVRRAAATPLMRSCESAQAPKQGWVEAVLGARGREFDRERQPVQRRPQSPPTAQRKPDRRGKHEDADGDRPSRHQVQKRLRGDVVPDEQRDADRRPRDRLGQPSLLGPRERCRERCHTRQNASDQCVHRDDGDDGLQADVRPQDEHEAEQDGRDAVRCDQSSRRGQACARPRSLPHRSCC